MAIIGQGITLGAGVTLAYKLGPVTNNLVLNLDALNYSGSGTTWPATVGPDATLYNGVTWTGSGPGYFTFDPASLQFADAPNIGDLGSWTVECWFNITTGWTSNGFPALVTTVYQDGGSILYGTINYVLSPYPDDTALTNGYYNGNWHNTAGFTPTIGEWYQMVGTFNGTTMKTYINGVEFSSAAGSGASTANGAPIRIARRWDGPENSQYYLPAEISVVRIYNAALNAGQVAQNFNALKSRFGIEPLLVTDGLIMNLDAGNPDSYNITSGSTWHDLSPAGNNGILQGPNTWTNDGDQSYFTFDATLADVGNILPNTAYTKIGIFRVSGNFNNLISGASDQHAFWGFTSQYLQAGHNGNWSTIASPVTTPLNEWVFGAVTFDSTTGWKLYLNDNPVVTSINTDQFTDDPALVQIGAYGGGNNLGGDIAAALVYNRALTEVEIAQNFAHYRDRFGL